MKQDRLFILSASLFRKEYEYSPLIAVLRVDESNISHNPFVSKSRSGPPTEPRNISNGSEVDPKSITLL